MIRKPIRQIGKTTLLIMLLFLSSCQTLSEIKDRGPEVKDGVTYGVTRGLFNFEWFDYYERALSFSAGEFWKKAEYDLLDAIQLKPGGERDSYTYGMHFINYYPHRELGVVYYHQGRFAEAKRELEKSLGFFNSAKTKLFLNMARKAHIAKNEIDKEKPTINIEYPDSFHLTNAFQFSIKGIAKDDTFVSDVIIENQSNGDLKQKRIDLSLPQIMFEESIALDQGENKISVEAKDLSGKKNKKEIYVIVDRFGPIISSNMPTIDVKCGGHHAKIKGYVYDKSKLSKLYINDVLIQRFSEQDEAIINECIPLHQGEKIITIKAGDIAGNVTEAVLDVVEPALSEPMNSYTVKLENFAVDRFIHDDRLPLSLKSISDANCCVSRYVAIKRADFIAQKSKLPIIKITFPKNNAVVYDDSITIQGRVIGNAITNAMIDGKTLDHLKIDSDGPIYSISGSVNLKDGKNVLDIRAENVLGYDNIKKITVFRKQRERNRLGFRMRVAIATPFMRYKVEGDNVKNILYPSLYIEDTLHSRMNEQYRFNVIKKLRKEEPTDFRDKNLLKSAYDEGIDYVLFGKVSETGGALELFIDIEDTVQCKKDPVHQTNEYSYGDKPYEVKNKVVSELIDNLLEYWPDKPGENIGEITNIQDDTIEIYFKDSSNVKECMALSVFETESDFRIDGMTIEKDIEIGRAWTWSKKGRSNIAAFFDQDTDPEKIKVGHKVIVR